MAKQLTSKDTLLFKVGGAPTASDVITTDNRIFVNPKAETIEYNDFGNGNAGNAKVITNDDDVTAEFNCEITARSSGVAGEVPSFAPLLLCCGLNEVIDAGVSVTYNPDMSENPATATAYLDGSKRDITGIAGDFSFSGDVGEIAKFSFSLKGFTTLEPTTEANPVVTLDTNSKLIVKSATVVTVGSGSIDLESFEFNLGNDTKKIYALETKQFFNGDFKPTLKVKAVKVKGNETHWSELKNNSKKIVKITLGDVAGNIIEFTAPYCNPMDVSESDSDAKAIYERTWLCENSAGADNFTLTFK